ncbi:unnamed protein product [Ostreobium quekettii]|uniref:Uncharacterized protein n=1 Tax=Ostreobium quekettii TaxID=121088 RepID=A0A8S1IYM0_9CHLO|nr:unnamed protein product [Ostreobium quekettii]
MPPRPRPRRFRGQQGFRKRSGRKCRTGRRAWGRNGGGRRQRRRRTGGKERDSGRNNLVASTGQNSEMGSGWWQRSTSHPVCPPAPLHEPQYLKDTAGSWRYDRPAPSVNGGVGSACRDEDSCGASGLSYNFGGRSLGPKPAPAWRHPGRCGVPNAAPGGKPDSLNRLFGPHPCPFDLLVESARCGGGLPDGIPPIAMEIINNLQLENQDLHLRVRQLEAHVGRPADRDTCSQMDEHLPDALRDESSQIGVASQC